MPGAFAIYQWRYYRRSRLPQRFKEMLEDEEMLEVAETVEGALAVLQ